MKSSFVLAMALCVIGTTTARAQSQPPGNPGGGIDPEGGPHLLTAWVDPVGGADGATLSAQEDQINDPDAPFKTLQVAIEAMGRALVDLYPLYAGEGIEVEGTVYALPGVYGPVTAATPKASGDVVPIVMRDRVHVQGFGANRCFLRGDDSESIYYIHWPNGSFTFQEVEVLLDLSHTSDTAPGAGQAVPPPWWDPTQPNADTIEVFNGFTFQGGDVQVYMQAGRDSVIGSGASWLNRAIVSNCVFDMRDGWNVVSPSGSTTVSGPTFGVYLGNRFTDCVPLGGDESGYLDTQLLVINNTFVMTQLVDLDWAHAKDDAIGIINVTGPGCSPQGSLSSLDCDLTLRGVARPGIVNNVFRTKPGSNQMAMLGIASTDTGVMVQGVPVQTNAFAPLRAGSQSPNFPFAGFTSLPVEVSVVKPYNPGSSCVFAELLDCGGTSTSWSGFCPPTSPPANCPASACTAAAAPTAAVSIYDGMAGVGADPAFVGEYLAQAFPTEFALDYADWRILPGALGNPHPFQDVGVVPDPVDDTIAMANGITYAVPDRPKVPKPFKWDGEYFGNPRIVDGYPDLGHDEIDLVIMTGSYSPNSTSHHAPGFLAPDLPTGLEDRYVIVRRYTPAVTLNIGNLIQINGTMETPSNPQAGWVQPPGTLVPPTIKTSLPLDYQTKWIRFGLTLGISLPWEHVVSAGSIKNDYTPIAGLGQEHAFVWFVVTDSEGSDHDYFNTQGVVYDNESETTDLLRANLQVEYR